MPGPFPTISSEARPRILVIRGGAIGDFILTLPALALLRDNFPNAHLEILGYKHIVALASGRHYADACRSIEYAPMARFFARGAQLDPELCEYFASFQQIVSYLYDPDHHFEQNLLRTGAKHILHANPLVDDQQHAARQLARPLESLALYLEDHRAVVHLADADRVFAHQYLQRLGDKPEAPAEIVAIHPGSGSPKKNWPIERWIEIGDWILTQNPQRHLLLVSGEADRPAREAIERAWPAHPRIHHAENLALTDLAGVLERCRLFLGHDSGISHLAAAVGTPCILLFGPTDPDVWAPAQPQVHILRTPSCQLAAITPDQLRSAATAALAH